MSNYIVTHGTTFYFRYTIPSDLYDKLEIKVIKFSLRTNNKRYAKRYAKKLASEARIFITEIRNSNLAYSQNKKNLSTNFKSSLKRVLNTLILAQPATEPIAVPLSGFPPAHTQPRLALKTRSTKPTISKIIEKYIPTVGSNENTREKYNFTLSEFKTISGDLTPEKISHETLRNYVQILSRLPRYYTSRFKDKPISELAKEKHEDCLTARSINDKVAIVSRFFKWCINQGYIETNFAEGKKVPGGKPTHSTHQAFSIEDLKQIFSTLADNLETFNKPFHFWLPLLALYTGARQAELAQMRCDDIKLIDDIWCLLVKKNDHDPNSRLKTTNAARIIPLHPVLIDRFAFHQFVARTKTAGNERVFSECKPYRGKYGKDVSAWFNNSFKRKLNIATAPGFKKDFHSFRNTLINTVKQAGCDIRMAEETFGHFQSGGGQSMSYDYYASPYSVRQRYEEVICKVEFPINWKLLLTFLR